MAHILAVSTNQTLGFDPPLGQRGFWSNKAIGGASTTIIAGIVDKTLKSTETSDHSQQGTERAERGTPESLVNEIKEKNRGKEEAHDKALMKIGLPKSKDRLLREIVEWLGPDGNQIDVGIIEKRKQTVNQPVENRFHGQGH